MITEDYYLKRHRRHELEEKKQKNREKECLRHGYYQQKQLVERIKTMDKSLLQSIVSSILHRNSLSLTSQQQVIDDHYLEQIHEQLLQNAVDHLARYEALGFKDHEPILVKQQQQQQQPILSQQLESKEKKEIEKSSPTKRKEIKTFGGYRTLKSQQGNRRSSRRLIAFGQRLPLFETQEFQLPLSIIKEKKKK
ncbi:uncharacterized protein BX663DRAFT_131170 [Cokeromyces recurvatus]|uniref:uncharacterized protein n=1 Tax=Cokeromyces recurvatus TaxID=90255 RepID=UPI00221E7D08|nr:uncharacterized protein BX663DRAFT_131170 [Cokeromyces recurvatus]KAI7907187.1 hypothetical protein BX663DRAFT_131170 [Cokeromyces recurvatus]